jgi:hypothetical protein
MARTRDAKFGGLDLAKRTDNTALTILTLKNGILHHTGRKIWEAGQTDYKTVAQDVDDIQHIENMNLIGVDRTGVGDAVMELFSPYLQKTMRPIITSAPTKIEIIDLIAGLFHTDRLRLDPTHSTELVKEILEQERKMSEAGNILYRHPQGTHDDEFWSLGYAVYVAAPYVNGFTRPTVRVTKTDRGANFDIDKEMRKHGYS